MAKSRIPDAASIVYCETCGKPTNGKGYYGPGCMGHEERPVRPVIPNDPWGQPPR